MADLDGFTERHPLNSRLVKRDGRLVEEVYRVGGRYHDADRPHRLRTCGTPRRWRRRRCGRRSTALIRFYETGDDGDREAFDIAWVQNHETTVDTMNGFIEVYMDARGIKGAWEGVVYYVNPEKTGKIRTLAAARAVVRGSPAGRSALPQAGGAGRVGDGHRGGHRDRRLGPDHADRRQPARTISASASSTAASPCRCRTCSTPTSKSQPESFRHEFSLGRRRSGACARVGGVRRRADDGDSRGARPRVGPHGRGRDGAAAGAAEGAVLGARGVARRPGRAVLRGRSVSGRRSA